MNVNAIILTKYGSQKRSTMNPILPCVPQKADAVQVRSQVISDPRQNDLEADADLKSTVTMYNPKFRITVLIFLSVVWDRKKNRIV